MFKPSKEQSSRYNKTARAKYKDDDKHRLKRLLALAVIRARERKIKCDLTIEDLLEMMPKDRKCPVLGIPLFWGSDGKTCKWNSPSLDRIISNGDYTRENVNIISWRANKIKGDCTADELNRVAEYMKK
jgi:hypothetical protein